MPNPDNPREIRDWFIAFQVKSPQEFRDATVRYRTVFGVRIMEASPGRRLTDVYTCYDAWHMHQADPGASDRLRSALREYLGLPNGKNSLDLLRGDADAINQQHREDRGLHNFHNLLNYLEVMKGDASWSPIQADLWQKQWGEKQRRAQRNAVVFFGNIKLNYNWSMLGLSGLGGMAGPASELIGDANLGRAADAVRNAAQTVGNAVSANPALAEIAAVLAGEATIIGAAARSEPDNSPDTPDYWQKVKDFLWGIYESLRDALAKQYEKIFRNAEIEYIGAVCGFICAIVFKFVAHEVGGLVTSSVELGTNTLVAIQAAISSMNLAAASAAVGVKHEYWRIIDGSLQWGESLAVASAVVGMLASVTSLLGKIFAGPLAPIIDIVIVGLRTVIRATYAYLTLRDVDKALDKARRMAEKIQAHEAGDGADSATELAIAAAQTNDEIQIGEIESRYAHVSRGLRKLDPEAYAVESRKMNREYAALIAQRNQPIAFDPALCTAEDILQPGGEFVRFLANMCYASPILTASLVLSGVMADAALVTSAFAASGPSEYQDGLSQDYLVKAGATARRLYTSSGFNIDPLPLNPHFVDIDTEWQEWVKLSDLHPTTIAAKG